MPAALTWPSAESLHAEVRAKLELIRELTDSNPEALLDLNMGSYRGAVEELLQRVSELARGRAS